MAVEVSSSGDVLQAGLRKTLFAGRYDTENARKRFVPAPDGQRFLLVSPLGREAMTPTTVVLNWAAELEK
jgi:hypothetical protein